MGNPLGFFIQGLGMGNAERDTAVNLIRESEIDTVSVMDNFGLCQEIQNARPECVVVHRNSAFEPNAGDGHDHTRDLVNFLNSLPQDKRIKVMVNCEPAPTAANFAMWTAMISTASQMGWSLVLPNLSAGSMKCGQGNDPNNWLTDGKAFVLSLAAHPEHYLSFHNYSGPFLWLVSNGTWGHPNRKPVIDWSKPQWHLGREIQGLTAACAALHFDLPNMIVTEGLFDQMADTEGNPDNPYRAIKSNRWRWLAQKWSEWYPGIPAEVVLADQYKWAWDNIYKPCGKVVGLHAFTYRDAGGQWADDRVDNAPTYLAGIKYYRPGAIVSPPPTKPPDPPPPSAQPVYSVTITIPGLSAEQAKAIQVETKQTNSTAGKT